MHAKGGLTALALCVAAMAIAGCHRCPAKLVSRAELFDHYNHNAEKVPGLRAIADVEIELADRVLFNTIRLTDGRLYFRRGPAGPEGPHYFLLRGKEVGQTFFELGIDPEAGEFFYWVKPPRGPGIARWGRLADLYKPGWETLPIDPMQLLSVLGIVPWPTDLAGPTQVVLKTPDKPCVYIMSVIARRPQWGGWYLQREEWLDRHTAPYRPQRIWLYDRQGRSFMEAELDRYEPIEAAGEQADRPVMPTDIEIRWPKGEGIRSIRIRLVGPTVIPADSRTPDPAVFRRVRRIPDDIDDARALGPIPPRAEDVQKGASK